MAVRSPSLYHALRCFCLGGFSVLSAEMESGVELPYSFEEHTAAGRPSLYEYRPLVRTFVEARADRLVTREDAKIAVEELRREPAAAIFARAHAGVKPTEEEALLRTVLMPLLTKTAEACGGFDWDDGAFDHAYCELEHSLFGERRSYAAIAPLIGLSAGTQIDLGRGLRVRPAATGELAAHWPEAAGLLPADFGREPDRMCVLELEQALSPQATEPRDAPAELADAVTALRLATAAPVAAGPVLFERLDWRPFGVRPVLPIAATQPTGEPSRLDSFRAGLARELLERLAAADDDPDLAEALDRWELSLFQDEPFRSEQLRESLVALLGGTDGLWAGALRASLLLGESGRERSDVMGRLRMLAGGERADETAADLLRRALVETLMHGNRLKLVEALDESLLGLRPRPAGYFAARAVA
ncbi:MAG TPA: hypothetical protein VF895_00050 [Gaiellaceae bacterium]